MLKKLAPHGNSLALVIEKAILDLLKIDADTPLEITTDGTALTITPVRDKKRIKSFKSALKRTNSKYGKMLKKLSE